MFSVGDFPLGKDKHVHRVIVFTIISLTDTPVLLVVCVSRTPLSTRLAVSGVWTDSLVGAIACALRAAATQWELTMSSLGSINQTCTKGTPRQKFQIKTFERDSPCRVGDSTQLNTWPRG